MVGKEPQSDVLPLEVSLLAPPGLPTASQRREFPFWELYTHAASQGSLGTSGGYDEMEAQLRPPCGRFPKVGTQSPRSNVLLVLSFDNFNTVTK